MTVRWSPTARAQLLAAIRRIHTQDPSAAVSFRGRIARAFQRIKLFPNSGPVVAEFPDLGYREVYLAPDRFFSKIEGETVWVIGVWHGAQVPKQPDE